MMKLHGCALFRVCISGFAGFHRCALFRYQVQCALYRNFVVYGKAGLHRCAYQVQCGIFCGVWEAQRQDYIGVHYLDIKCSVHYLEKFLVYLCIWEGWIT